MSQIELASHQVSRRSVPWMLAAVIASLLPHVTHIPWWLTAVCVLGLGWRWGVHAGRMSYPSRRWQALFAILLIGGVLVTYRTVAGHMAGTALLIAMFTLKLLEMYKERDAYVVIVIGYFVAALAFLFHFTLWMGFYVLGVTTLLTAALVAVNMSLEAPLSEPLKRASTMLLQSIPVAILLFVVLPRIGPLWATGLKPSDAKTGMSDEISMGSVGSLAQSDELAFRVDFKGKIPPSSQLYWRGLTLADFDGQNWHQVAGVNNLEWMTWYPHTKKPTWLQKTEPAIEQGKAQQRALDYTVYLQPTQRSWLFALDMPLPLMDDIGLLYDHRLRAKDVVKTLMRYDVTSVTGIAWDLDVPAWYLDYHRQLPAVAGSANGNPQARQWAAQKRAESVDDAAYLQAVLALFRDGGFRYTLTPPRLGQNPVDEFLFTTRRGFCEHYASAFTFLMRAGGIPARVVAGYQGGEVNDIGGTVQVRQYDAHAWSEAWLPGRGWVMVDPTAVVAPERISKGSRQTLGFDASPLGFSAVGAIGNSLRTLGEMVDFMNHGWNRWVLGFTDQAQEGLLTKLLGKASPYRIAMLVLFVGIASVLLVSLWMFRGEFFVRRDPVLREYVRFCNAWAARGVAREPSEGPFDYMRRLQAFDAKRANDVQRFVVMYVGLAYGRKTADAKTLQKLRAARVIAV